MTKLTSALCINNLELSVHLGWPKEERQQKQIVLVDVKIRFNEPPKACLTDTLEDTFCYATLIETIRNHFSAKEFHLIEHLGAEIYHLIKSELPCPSSIRVQITKHPDIQGLMGGVRFSYGDDHQSW